MLQVETLVTVYVCGGQEEQMYFGKTVILVSKTVTKKIKIISLVTIILTKQKIKDIIQIEMAC